MPQTVWLLAQSSSESDGFSVPILAAAAAVGLAWLAAALLLAVVRRVPDVDAGPPTQELPDELPAVAGMLCDDFEVASEAVPATLLDLAARKVVTIEEIQPGRTICRVGRSNAEGLTEFERRVLAAVTTKAIDGVVPAEALTTGPEDASKGWTRDYEKEVIAEAQGRGLTYDRWPKALVGFVGFGFLAVFGLLWLAGAVGGETTGDEGRRAAITGGVAVVTMIAIAVIAGRWGRSLAQLPTEEGERRAAACLSLQRHLHENEHFDEVPPASVVIWGRHLAYAAALGAAQLCVAALPMGAEDDRHAWSRFGRKWRKVRVRYPRALPPGWGKHPAFAGFLGIVWGSVAAAALYGLLLVANADPTPDPTFTREQLDWIGRAALIACIPFVAVLGWALWVLVRAVPDLWQRRELTGEVVRARRRQQIFQSRGEDDPPKYWYYLAIDDGSDNRLPAFRVRKNLYDSCNQGQTVTVEVTPNLGYVRELMPPAAGSSASHA
ncbi:MAG TPA: hypothetical protein VMQ81_04340 [Acidimicrobiia bacterium]|nr:hypothetical protein [Acidimicrobiia bacterium]